MTNKDENIMVVILAAGESRRFGAPKQMADWFGVPLLQHVISQLTALVERPYLMLGAHYKTILDGLNLDACLVRRVENWQLGMSAPIAQAAAELEDMNQNQGASIKGLLFLLADQPLLRQEDIATLLQAANMHPDEIICADYRAQSGGGRLRYSSKSSSRSRQKESFIDASKEMAVVANMRRSEFGVPAYFPARYTDQLIGLSRQEEPGGAKRIVAENPHVLIKLGDRVRDVDTPEDLAKLSALFESRQA